MIAPIAISIASGSPRLRDQRDHGDHRLRQRRADGRQDRADGAGAEVQPVAEPLDGVGEADRPADDEDEGGEQLEGDDHSPELPVAGARILSPAMATADLTVIALGREDVSASGYIAEIQRRLAAQDRVRFALHAMGTSLEGTTRTSSPSSASSTPCRSRRAPRGSTRCSSSTTGGTGRRRWRTRSTRCGAALAVGAGQVLLALLQPDRPLADEVADVDLALADPRAASPRRSPGSATGAAHGGGAVLALRPEAALPVAPQAPLLPAGGSARVPLLRALRELLDERRAP